MNAKWFFSTFLIVLAYFGFFQDKDLAPNQQVVLEFVNTAVAKEDVQKAIEDVRQQLLDAGATNIKVQEAKDNTLKISYYSVVTVANIKQVLTKDQSLVIDYASNTTDSNSSSSPVDSSSNYNLDVHEIKASSDASNLGGKYVLEVKYDSDRFTNPNVYFPLVNTQVNKTDHIVKTAYKVNKYVVVAIDNTSHKEPEVRAGPIG
ncbi:hypothetical protein [Seonamhaeicola marinus]|uniref:Uncharacterized protein n=1 Tax=Seonamhaeicola marinus TaxID=1912246 RepID=A0A5D0IRW2_9FLAO|nr:hypothetical protein [Seonamhaeicola marinus]TYA84392.1 hypothetical protein FUA24_07035 [Seonamhaeicola marinus]